jgi:multiple sugar transport system permease protein
MTQSRLLPYALIAPAVIFLLALFVAPLVQTIVLSFHDGATVSLANYHRMATDLKFEPA